MKNIIAKVLLGISAMAVAGALSFVPATKAEATNYFDYSLYAENDDLYVGGEGYDFTASFDIADFHMSGYGDTHDNIKTNIWFGGASQNEDITLSIELPFPVTGVSFIDYWGASNIDDYVPGDCGNLYSCTLNGNVLTITGNTANSFGIDAYYRFSLWVPKSAQYLFNEEINNVSEDIIKAAQGLNHDGSENPQKVVFYNCNGAVNYRIIQALAQTQGVTLLYTFEYEGYVFTSAITSEMAAQIFIEGEDWYGPCYIAKYCPTVLVDVVK